MGHLARTRQAMRILSLVFFVGGAIAAPAADKPAPFVHFGGPTSGTPSTQTYQSPSTPACPLQRVAVPTGYGCQEDQECTTSYENECKTSYEQECKTKNEQRCETKYEDKCETKYEDQCSTEYKQECETKYDTQCETKYDTVYEDKCETKYEDSVRQCMTLLMNRNA